MSRATRLGNHIERTVTGPMWHGPALLEVLDGVDAARARARPIAGAHSIWEIVKHVTAWADFARRRISAAPPPALISEIAPPPPTASKMLFNRSSMMPSGFFKRYPCRLKGTARKRIGSPRA